MNRLNDQSLKCKNGMCVYSVVIRSMLFLVNGIFFAHVEMCYITHFLFVQGSSSDRWERITGDFVASSYIVNVHFFLNNSDGIYM